MRRGFSALSFLPTLSCLPSFLAAVIEIGTKDERREPKSSGVLPQNAIPELWNPIVHHAHVPLELAAPSRPRVLHERRPPAAFAERLRSHHAPTHTRANRRQNQRRQKQEEERGRSGAATAASPAPSRCPSAARSQLAPGVDSRDRMREPKGSGHTPIRTHT